MSERSVDKIEQLRQRVSELEAALVKLAEAVIEASDSGSQNFYNAVEIARAVLDRDRI